MLNETPSSGTHYVAPVLEELGSFQEETGFFGFHGRESILVVPYKW